MYGMWHEYVVYMQNMAKKKSKNNRQNHKDMRLNSIFQSIAHFELGQAESVHREQKVARHQRSA